MINALIDHVILDKYDQNNYPYLQHIDVLRWRRFYLLFWQIQDISRGIFDEIYL
jgi:hypothetical protein